MPCIAKLNSMPIPSQNSDLLLHTLADGKFHSGQILADTMGISRTAVWKKLNSLQNKYALQINSVKGRGYQLSPAINFINPEVVLKKVDDPENLELHSFVELDSTNQWLLEQHSSNKHAASIHKKICHAEFQRHGRGRREKKWLSPLGCNLYFSIGWCFELPMAGLSQLSLLTGVALVETLESIGVKNAGLKWPNDIYIADKKLAGILIELRGEATGPTTAVIGIGINISMPESSGNDIDQAWTDISQHCRPLPSRNDLLALFIQSLVRMLTNFTDITTEQCSQFWKKYDILNSRNITIQTNNTTLSGIARGIHDDGSLIVSIDGSNQYFHAGDVSLKLT